MLTKNSHLRYLTIERLDRAGFKHVLGQLTLLVVLAAVYKRQLVLPLLRPAPHNNQNLFLPDMPFDKYLDFKRSHVELSTPNGRSERLTVGDISVKSLEHARLDASQTLVFDDPRQLVKRTPSELERQAVIALRSEGKDLLFLRKKWAKPDRMGGRRGTLSHFKHRFRLSDGRTATVDWQPAPQVLELKRGLRKVLGDHYAVAHLRRGDYADYALYERIATATTLLKKMRRVVPRNTTVYLMTDEHSPGYFDALMREYKIVRHSDFEQLNQALRMADYDSTDYYLLYVVELCIQLDANLEVHTYRPDHHRSMATAKEGIYWLMEIHPHVLARLTLSPMGKILERLPIWLINFLFSNRTVSGVARICQRMVEWIKRAG